MQTESAVGVEVSISGNVATVSLTEEEINDSGARQCASRIQSSVGPHVCFAIINLYGVTSACEAFFESLVVLHNLCKSHGGGLALFNVSRSVRKSIEQHQDAKRVLLIANSQEEALAAVQR